LVLEATIGFNKRSSAEESQREEEGTSAPQTVAITLTRQDQEFLKAMKIVAE
jgi:hypothetical protein